MTTSPNQLRRRGAQRVGKSAGANRLLPADRPVHDWYRFVLSFPPHLVREYLTRFGVTKTGRLLDPYCGTGTTLVEARLSKISAFGIEANPMAAFASRVKTDWSVNPETLLRLASEITDETKKRLQIQGIRDDRPGDPSKLPGGAYPLSSEILSLFPKNAVSPLPLHKTLHLIDVLNARGDAPEISHLRLALAAALVSDIGNLHFGPEVGLGKIKTDVPVIAAFQRRVSRMAADLTTLSTRLSSPSPPARVIAGDARNIKTLLEPASIDAVITSPPYPNEKDYSRTTRLESVLLGFITSRGDLRNIKKNLVRSNTRGVYKDDDDDAWIAENPEVEALARRIENRRIELNKTSGFERLYARVTRLYFGGMTRHLSELRNVLRPGAQLAYVVGDQASFFRVLIRTGTILSDIAESLGYEKTGIDLFRHRTATATGNSLREEVVRLRWPG